MTSATSMQLKAFNQPHTVLEGYWKGCNNNLDGDAINTSSILEAHKCTDRKLYPDVN